MIKKKYVILLIFCFIPFVCSPQYSIGAKVGPTYSKLNQINPYYTWDSSFEPGLSTELFLNYRISERFSSNLNLGYENLNSNMAGVYGSKFESYKEEGVVKIHYLFFDVQPRIVLFKSINLDIITGLSIKRMIRANFKGIRDGEPIDKDITSEIRGDDFHLQLGFGYQFEISKKFKLIVDGIVFRSISDIQYHSENFKTIGAKVNLGVSYSFN